MSVLACTIGALTLLLASLSLSAVAPPEPGARPESGAPADGALPDGSTGLASAASASTGARERTSGGGDAVARLDALEALWRRVDAALAAAGSPTPLALEALERRLAATARTRRLEDDLRALTEAERSLAREGEQIEASISVLESRRETLPILIDPTGLSRHLEPWFVECDAGGVTAYRVSDGLSHFVPRDALDGSGDFARYLRRLKVSPGALLVLLVRPDGLATAALAGRMAEAAGVRSAQLPLPGRGELDWSLLRRAEEANPR